MVGISRKVDKHVLYQKSVQSPSSEVQFFNRTYKAMRGRLPKVLREDFCGTAAVTCHWVKQGKDRRGFGIDLHGSTLRWAEKHNVSALGPDASRVRLIQGNVLDRQPFKADVVAALNFSYFTFKDRPTLLRYAKSVSQGLAPEGIFVLDIYGGPDSQVVQEEEAKYNGFTYVWDQERFNPVTGHILCHIHFKLPDRKVIKKAFTYDWRLWSLPEVTDILKEAGFKKVEVYWEGTDHGTGEGNGIFRRTVRGDDAESWIAYIVATK